jgi:glycosyltransferase
MYGIGTYVKQLSDCIRSMDDTYLHLININCDLFEFEINREKDYCEYFFPFISNKIGSYDYRNIFFIFYKCLKMNVDDELIVHLNCMHQYDLAKWIKIICPNCLIILTVHYLFWSILLKGNILHFNNIIEGKVSDKYNIMSLIEDDKKILNTVDYIICLSNHTKKILIEFYRISSKKVKMIYNGLKDEYEVLNSKAKLKIRKDLHFSVNENMILFVGRLDQIKGLDILIDAFKLILHKGLNFRLVIVGEGDYSKYFKECKNYWSKITFTGPLEKEYLYKIYKIADVGVMASMHEQCSYVAIEMLMFNIPLIISTTPGLNEVLDNEENKIKVVELNEDVVISSVDLSLKIQSCMARNTTDYRNIYVSKYKFDIMLNNMKSVYNLKIL